MVYVHLNISRPKLEKPTHHGRLMHKNVSWTRLRHLSQFRDSFHGAMSGISGAFKSAICIRHTTVQCQNSRQINVQQTVHQGSLAEAHCFSFQHTALIDLLANGCRADAWFHPSKWCIDQLNSEQRLEKFSLVTPHRNANFIGCFQALESPSNLLTIPVF